MWATAASRTASAVAALSEQLQPKEVLCLSPVWFAAADACARSCARRLIACFDLPTRFAAGAPPCAQANRCPAHPNRWLQRPLVLLAAKPNAACARPCVSFRAHISAAAPPAAKMVVRGGGGCGGSVGGGAAVRARVGRSRARLRLGVDG